MLAVAVIEVSVVRWSLWQNHQGCSYTCHFS